jgi:hypothetical protein
MQITVPHLPLPLINGEEQCYLELIMRLIGSLIKGVIKANLDAGAGLGTEVRIISL